jgi:hypothetical protein
MSLIKSADREYPDRRDRYGYTLLKRMRAIRAIRRDDDVSRILLDNDLLPRLASMQAILPFKKIDSPKSPYVFIIQEKLHAPGTPSEWSGSMFFDAALLILQTEKMLTTLDMTVDDPHPWNILFHQGKPYITDLGAFNTAGTGLHWGKQEEKNLWPASAIYEAFFRNPIYQISAGRGARVRQNMQDWYAFSNSDTAVLLLKKPAFFFPFIVDLLIAKTLKAIWRVSGRFIGSGSKRRLKLAYLDSAMHCMTRLRKQETSDRLRREPPTNQNQLQDQKLHALLIKDHALPEAKSVLAYSASEAQLATLCRLTKAKVAFMSPDESLIDRLYNNKNNGLALAVMDLRSPTPGTGPNNRWITPALERYQSDFGIFFLVLQELVIDKCMRVSELIDTAYALTGKASLLIFQKSVPDVDKPGRDYGQVNDDVILSRLERQLRHFELISNTTQEMIVRIERRNPAANAIPI